MHRKLAMIAAVAITLGACSAPASRSTTPSPATSIPSIQPSPAAPSPTIQPVAMPLEVWGDWEAETTQADEIAPDDHIQLSLNWQDGLAAWVQTPGGDLVLESTSASADPGEIRLVTTEMADGCAIGDEGTYRWDRSADGMFLTLTPIRDACALRAKTIGRTWVHSLSAVNDGGRGVSGFNATFEITLPRERFAMSGPEGLMEIHSDAGHQLIVIENPAGYREPCAAAATRTTLSIERTAAAFETYLHGLPGVAVDATAFEIDGRHATHLAIASSATIDCPAGEVFVYRPDNQAAEADISVSPGSPLSLWAVQAPTGIYVFQYLGPSVTSEGEAQVMSTIRFFDKLPTS